MKKRFIAILLSFTVASSAFLSGCDLDDLSDLPVLSDLLDVFSIPEESIDVKTAVDKAKEEEEQRTLEELTVFPNEDYANNFYIDTDIHYYFNQLSEEDQKTYSAILTGLKNVEPNIKLRESNSDTIRFVLDAVMYDHPELFWCDGSFNFVDFGAKSTFSPTYTCEPEEIGARKRELSTITNEFLRNVPADASDYDKIKLVYDYVITSVEYDEDAADNQNLYSSLVNKTSVCAGYAREIQYLLQRLDIQCIYVVGNIVDGDGHAWNIVKYNDKYYQIDATFGDWLNGYSQNAKSGDSSEDSSEGTSDASDDNDTANETSDDDSENSDDDADDISDKSYPEELTIDYSYFLCTDAHLYTDHIAETTYELPVCDSNDMNHYLAKGTYYESYSDEFLTDMRESIYAGETFWECQFANQEDYQQAMEEMSNNTYAETVIDYLEDYSIYGDFTMSYANDDAIQTIKCWY